jgi:hypothetical protein
LGLAIWLETGDPEGARINRGRPIRDQIGNHPPGHRTAPQAEMAVSERVIDVRMARRASSGQAYRSGYLNYISVAYRLWTERGDLAPIANLAHTPVTRRGRSVT